MKLKPDAILEVALEFAPGDVERVGRLAFQREGLFEFDPGFAASGLRPEPLGRYPFRSGVIRPRDEEGRLHGVFADSLPESWGEILLRRACAKATPPLSYASLTPLDRLAWIGRRGQGALVYQPAHPVDGADPIDIDLVAGEAQAIVAGEVEEVTERLVRLGGASGGARPKALIGIGPHGQAVAGDGDLPPGYEAWIVKFRAGQHDVEDIGPLEMAYSDMAATAGLEVAESRLIPARRGFSYFATKRFDRLPGGGRVHMLSVAGALGVSKDTPASYEALLDVVRFATRSEAEVLKAFRRMVFNVIAWNRDDHLRQHAFLMDRKGGWRLSPSFDLTHSEGAGGEHMLTVGGEGRRPGPEHVAAAAQAASIKAGDVQDAVRRTVEAASGFRRIAQARGVGRRTAAEVAARLDAQVKLFDGARGSGKAKRR